MGECGNVMHLTSVHRKYRLFGNLVKIYCKIKQTGIAQIWRSERIKIVIRSVHERFRLFL